MILKLSLFSKIKNFLSCRNNCASLPVDQLFWRNFVVVGENECDFYRWIFNHTILCAVNTLWCQCSVSSVNLFCLDCHRDREKLQNNWGRYRIRSIRKIWTTAWITQTTKRGEKGAEKTKGNEDQVKPNLSRSKWEEDSVWKGRQSVRTSRLR